MLNEHLIFRGYDNTRSDWLTTSHKGGAGVGDTWDSGEGEGAKRGGSSIKAKSSELADREVKRGVRI